jgi:V/A-type H+-transporting ATPase subunit A
VSQATLRVAKVFWSLDAPLAYRRHFPAVHWLNSYSLYLDDVQQWWQTNVASDWRSLRDRAIELLQKEAELEEIVKLVGIEALSDKDRLLLETTKSIREDFLYQDATHEIDTYASAKKQYEMLKVILKFHDLAMKALDRGVHLEHVLRIDVRTKISKMRVIEETAIRPAFRDIEKDIDRQMADLSEKSGSR